MQNNNRLAYIDLLRGIAILLIVFGHIPQYCYGEGASALPSFRTFTSMVQIPIFFFVSGFVLNTEKMLMGGGKTIIVRLRQLIFPAIFWGGLYITINNIGVYDCISDKFKSGYWFTVSLFEFIVLQYVFEYAMKWLKVACTTKAYLTCLSCATLMMYVLSIPSISAKLGDAAGVVGTPSFRYYIYFVCGLMMRRYIAKLLEFKHKDAAMAVCMCVFLMLAVANWCIGIRWSGITFHANMVMFETTALLILFTTAYKAGDYAASNTTVARTLRFVGQRTLDIYMLHYFFLPEDLHMAGEYFTSHNVKVLEFIFSGILTIVITGVCIAAGEFVRTSTLVSRYVLGTK